MIMHVFDLARRDTPPSAEGFVAGRRSRADGRKASNHFLS